MNRRMPLFVLFGFMLFAFSLSHASGQAPGETGSIPEVGVNKDGIEQSGQYWYDPAWNYRRLITITNNGSSFLYYQVLLALNVNNFDFDLAKNNGEDIRFTFGDGTTPIPFWIESWDKPNRRAYVWVKVLALNHGSTTIYLYYNNPSAISDSNGAMTFDGFDDDWEQFNNTGQENKSDFYLNKNSKGILNPFIWYVIGGTPQVSPDGYVILGNGKGIYSANSFQNAAVGFRASFGSGNGNQWAGFYNEGSGKQAVVSDHSCVVPGLCLRNYNTVDWFSDIPPLAGGWNLDHIFEVRWCTSVSNCNPLKTSVDVDHGLSGTYLTDQVPNTALPVTLHNKNMVDSSELRIYWVYVRSYDDDELDFDIKIGERQGLVMLSLDGFDTPDPLPKNHPLTYQLTVSNNGSIDAPGVVVTDTLPLNVILGKINPSQGNCTSNDSMVSCDLGSIIFNSIAQITIVITPTVDGQMTNNAIVGSPGYELDLSDNTTQQVTLVESIPPVVNWEAPVHKGGTYYAYGGLVEMGASATDNDQVAWVEFLLWAPGYVRVGIDYSYPFQTVFDTSKLTPGLYQLFVRGGDRAGNVSDPQNPVQRIFLIRRLPVLLPQVFK